MNALARLENENFRLEEENRILRQALVDDYEPPLWLKIPRTELIILRCILKRDRVTRQTLETIVYGSKDTDVYNGINCHVSKLKSKLRPLGIGIKNERLVGYRMAVEDKQKLRAL